MNPITETPGRVEMARKCLMLIRDIADRGAWSSHPEQVGYALQELTQVLVERTGTEERQFEPISANEIVGLKELYEELDFVNCSSQGMSRPH